MANSTGDKTKMLYSPYTPDKLTNDALVEALCEFQFECSEVAEIVIGRLSDNPDWHSYNVERLPYSEIPSAIRDNDPNLKFGAILQLRSNDGSFIIKIGGNVISLHNLNRYCGWANFQPKLNTLVDFIFKKLTNLHITRIGFRYTNALTPEKHLVHSLSELNLSLIVADSSLDGHVNLNYGTEYSKQHIAMTRLASKSFVQGKLPSTTAAVIDIDIATKLNMALSDKKDVKNWVDEAHAYEKDAFFRLIPVEISKKLELS